MRLRFPARLFHRVPRIPQPLPLAVVPQLVDEDSGVRGSRVDRAVFVVRDAVQVMRLHDDGRGAAIEGGEEGGGVPVGGEPGRVRGM